MKKPVLNSVTSVTLPESVEEGKPFVIQLAPKGEYPQFIDDPDNEGQQKEVVQILDDTSIQTLVDNFKDKVLVDADHSSETSTNTRAYAWVTKLFVDPEKGLMAEIEPTKIGAEAINGKEYRFVSGAWTLADDGRPEELVSIGLTNKPNLPVAPMINAQTDKKETSGTTANADGSVTKEISDAEAAAKKAKEAQNQTTKTTTKGVNSMDIRAKLGLPAEAKDEEVEQALDALLSRSGGMEQVANALGMEPTATNEELVEAVNAVVSQCGELQAKNAEDEKARLNAEAEQLITENEEIIPEESVEEIKAQYVEDPEAAKATVANMRKVYERAVLNASRAHQPEKKEVVINWRSAKKPVATNMETLLAECGGDPEKENAALRMMGRS